MLHEFSSIKGVREDVTDIVLNVKNLALKSSSSGVKKLVLDVKGPKEVKAKDITSFDVEILNPDLTICNQTKNSFPYGVNGQYWKRIYATSKNKSEDNPLGLITMNYFLALLKKLLIQLTILDLVMNLITIN